MVYEGPREGSQAKPQHFPQTAPFGFYFPARRRRRRHAHALFNLHPNAFSLSVPFNSRRRWSAASVDEADAKKEGDDGKTGRNVGDDLAGNRRRRNTVR